jgi:hypothetical protein
MKTVKYKCGCTAELHREAWSSLCPLHEAEFQAIHQRWAEEHKAGKVIEVGIFSNGPKGTVVKRVKYETPS